MTRVADVDHGGVLADQRTADREVLGAMLRLPDTGFAVHDTADHFARLLAERAEHERILATNPPERLRHVLAATRELDYARNVEVGGSNPLTSTSGSDLSAQVRTERPVEWSL